MTELPLVEARAMLAELADGTPRAGAVRLRYEAAPGREVPVARLEIDHPEARGAISLAMMVDLADAVEALRAWDGAFVVLSSTDRRAFCSGGHLGQVTRAVADPERAARMARAMAAVLDALLDLPQITVAAIDGLAMGGGAEIVTATDFRVAGAEARIHFVHSRLGIVPGWGGAGRLVRLIGRGPALRILSRGRPLLPGEALQIGLIDHRCDAPAVDGALTWLADAFDADGAAIRAAKLQVRGASPVRAGADVAAEIDAFASVWGGPAHVRALAALERHR